MSRLIHPAAQDPSRTPAAERPVDDMAPAIRPVFIVGMNGSGTTMLADSLGFHPKLYMFPFEVLLLPYLVKKARAVLDLGQIEMRRRIGNELCASKPFWHANGRKPLVLADDNFARPGLDATIDAVFMHFAAAAGKRRWGEKSPMNLLHMELLASVFPQAQFVHIVRDARDAAQSFHRRYGFVPEETVYRWKRAVRAGRAAGRRLGADRYLELRYEELTASPEAWMRRVCGFLDLPFDPVLLSSSMRMTGGAMRGKENRIMRNSGKWRDYFSPADVVRLESYAGKALADLGYPTTLQGDADPSRLRRLAWRVSGIWRRTYLHFRQWGWAGVRGYLKRIPASIKQARAGR